MARGDAGREVQEKVRAALDAALALATKDFASGTEPTVGLSPRLLSALREVSAKTQKAASGFTNIVTCLAIKASHPNVDIRYFQIGIQKDTDRPAGFNFRTVSEKVVYPWLSSHTFENAKSGWQTRTYERPKPYMMTYDENIAHIKVPFLTTFDEIETNAQSASQALRLLIYLQLAHRESKSITLSVPRTRDIRLIVEVFRKHFFHSYSASKGASRLPVLALYAIYESLLTQLDRFSDMELKPLEEHSAADSQTGALGDIEVARSDGTIFEVVDVKHGLPIADEMIAGITSKVMDKSVDRYYILTTHSNCEPNAEQLATIENIEALYGCQVIANGVIPTIKYYLRLLRDPSEVFRAYVNGLGSDPAIKHEHREVWNKIALSKQAS